MDKYRSIWKYLYRTPFKIDWIDVEGVNTRYLEAGSKDAPPVILLHGMMGSIENFTANIAEYAKHFHVYAIDMLGCGWTDRPDYPYTIGAYVEHLRGFMDAVSIERAAFVGVSLGSATSAYFSFKFPERSAAFVMVAPSGIVDDVAEFEDYITKGVAGRREAALNPTWDNMRSVFSHLVYDDDVIIDDLISVRQEMYQDPSLQAAMSHLTAPAREVWKTHEEWKALQTPALVIGSPDVPSPFLSNARLIARLMPNATLVDIPKTDHWAQYEQPEIFNPLSIEFIKQHHG